MRKMTYRPISSRFHLRLSATGPLVLLLIIAVIFASGCKPVHDEMDRYLEAAHDVWGFQGSALVAYKGKVILAKGYGMANYTFDEPNTPQTKFFIGSITKQFTAAAIMILQERGLLNVHDPISKYLPDYPKATAERITIENLLTHTSGVPNYTEVPELMLKRTRNLSPSDLLDLFKDEPLEFEPGTDFHYSNSGYIILGAIIEKVSGQSYEAFLHHEILNKAGMHNSGYARREAGLPDRADGYTIDDRRAPIAALPISFSVLHTAGAMYSTVEDMLKWDQALYNQQVLSRQSVDQMLTPHSGNYGYGWVIESLFGHRHTFHGGFIDGFNTTFDRWVDDSLCVVVFSNEDEAPVKKIARSLAAIAFHKPYVMPERKEPVALDPAVLANYVGVYRQDRELQRLVTVTGDTLFSQLSGEPPERLFLLAVDTFFLESDNTSTMIFDRDSLGVVTSATLYDGISSVHADKLSGKEAEKELTSRTPVEVSESTLDEYVGLYDLRSRLDDSASDFTLTIIRQGRQLRAAATGTGEVDLLPSSETEFFHRQSDLRVVFKRDESGQVVGCILRMGTAWVEGKKVR